MRLHKLFAVPVFTFKFDSHDSYDFPDVERKDRKPEGWITSLNSTFPRIPDDDPLVPIDLRNHLMNDLGQQIAHEFIELGIPDKFYFSDFWYNIYHDTQGQEPHSHLNGSLSKNPYWCGIYYNKGTTPTTFIRHDINNRIHKFPHKNSDFNELFADTMKPQLQDGDVILFPPYLSHCVEPSTSDTMRMTFSFNMVLDNE